MNKWPLTTRRAPSMVTPIGHRKGLAFICCGLYERHTQSKTFNLLAFKKRVLININSISINSAGFDFFGRKGVLTGNTFRHSVVMNS
jgi:hypothetical protein